MTERLLKDYLGSWNSGDIAGVVSFFADDLIYEDVALEKKFDRSSIEQFLRETFENFSSLRFDLVTYCGGKDSISWEWRMVGTRKDGSSVDVPGMSMTEVKDGKIARNRDYWSTLPAPKRDH